MLVDLRYHIITVVIIFVTLSIGILIGSSMVGSEVIVQEQQELISNLEEDFRFLRNQNEDFKKEVCNLEVKLADNIKFQEMIMPLVVKEQLKDERLLLVLGKNVSKELKKKIVNVLELANVKELIIKEDISNLNEENFVTRILLLGDIKEEMSKEYQRFNKKIVGVESDQLTNVSNLIRLVFEIAAKDLQGLRGVKNESINFNTNSSL